jgi:hypothetical protein
MPELTVVTANASDERVQLLAEAVRFWNETLAGLGSGFRLGSMVVVTQPVPDQALVRLSEAVLSFDPANRTPYQNAYRAVALDLLDKDLVVMLAENADFISFTASVNLMNGNHHAVVAIKSTRLAPLNLPNVAQNVIAHELGHAIGLQHNADPTMLMCGRPNPCRPDAFMSGMPRYYPLTQAEKSSLLAMYPADWRPSP